MGNCISKATKNEDDVVLNDTTDKYALSIENIKTTLDNINLSNKNICENNTDNTKKESSLNNNTLIDEWSDND